MAVTGQKTRVVYSRLSESEFSSLVGMCRSVDGERSVSELVRTAVRLLLSVSGGQPRTSPEPLPGYIRRELDGIHDRLDEVLRRLASGEPAPPRT